MNERIKELAEQATSIQGPTPYNPLCWEDELEKFAQLIVWECAQVADKAEPYQTSDLIREHFGVEE